MDIENKFFILLVVFFASIHFSTSTDYCNITSCQSSSAHVLCLYPTPKVSEGCNQDLNGGLSDDEIADILDEHNSLRRIVASGQETNGNPGPQPAAKSIPDLEWDEELAEIAQRWADQCDFKHDECRDVERFPVGQNIAWSGTTGDVDSIKVTEMVQSWYNEVKNFDKDTVSEFKSTVASNGEVIGHYTQLIWATTTKIGCGVRKYFDGHLKRSYLVCNYGPAGNFVGKPLYEILEEQEWPAKYYIV